VVYNKAAVTFLNVSILVISSWYIVSMKSSNIGRKQQYQMSGRDIEWCKCMHVQCHRRYDRVNADSSASTH